MRYLSKAGIENVQQLLRSEVGGATIFSYPEKVLQFGTGVLLRALPDMIIDHANKKGLFKGSIVVVKSTGVGGADAFNKQDNLYTVCVRGIAGEKKIEENQIISSVSRVLVAATQWDAILETAVNPHMQVIISNTTEAGIVLMNESIHNSPPSSFPGKLLSFLYRRFQNFGGDIEKGMVVIPTELITGNADKLFNILIELARHNGLETSFLDWLKNSNYFCNSLVDRIVPGKFAAAEQEIIENTLGYKDELAIMCEPYALWAIESGDKKVNEILSFGCEEGVSIAPDISKFYQLKLRLLNGSHTFSCGLAFLAGFSTVKEAMADACFFTYLRQLIFDEIIPPLIGPGINKHEAEKFASSVLDRFRNTFLSHKWLNICLQYSSKMRLRNTDTITGYMLLFNSIPFGMALGMAAHILFMKTTKGANGKFYGMCNGNSYLVEDDNAALYTAYWKNYPLESMVTAILTDKRLWGKNFKISNTFQKQTYNWLALLIDNGALHTLQNLHSYFHFPPAKIHND